MTNRLPFIKGILALIVFSASTATSAFAKTACETADNPDVIIASCTDEIRSGRYAGSSLAVLYINRGAAYLKKKQGDLALQDYNEATRLSPKDFAPYFGRGEIYRNARQYDRATHEYDESLRLGAEPHTVHVFRGIAYYLSGKYDQAIADFNEAIQINARSGTALYYRGLSKAKLGDAAGAKADNAAAREIYPSFPPLQ